MFAHYAGYFYDADGRGRGNKRDIREHSAFNAKAKASKKEKGDGVRECERKWATKLLKIICATYISGVQDRGIVSPYSSCHSDTGS